MSATQRDTLTVPISEVFGPVVQGEGPLAGNVTAFVRVAGCDYRCSWCDTPYAVLPALWARTAERLTYLDIVERVVACAPHAPWVTLSGGNPALYDLEHLVDELSVNGYKSAIETQGSTWSPWMEMLDLIVWSPKPPSSGWHARAEKDAPHFAPQVIHSGVPAAMKVVVFDRDDFLWARALYDTSGWADAGRPLYLSVGTTPGGDLADVRRDVGDRYAWLVREVCDATPPLDAIVLPQLHVLAFGHARGV